MRLAQSGEIIDPISNSTLQSDKRARLVYAGVFQSIDGEVEITPVHLEVLVKNHNEKIEKLGEQIKMSDYPPIQLDHSTSAKDTVGRLVGKIELGMFEKVPALYGHVRMLGQENWEKVNDGRWTHLSIGADLEKGEIHELTITPFPAAKNACFLTQQKPASKTIMQGVNMPQKLEDLKAKHLQEMEDLKAKHLTETEGKELDEELKKKHLAECEDLKAKHLAECEECTKKLAEIEIEIEDEKESKKEIDDEKPMKKLSLSHLSALQENAKNLQLRLRVAQIKSRFTKLKAQAKITPAEMSKLDFARLAKTTPETLKLLLETFEAREPVILTGQYGTIKATNAAEIAKEVKLANLEAETRARMKSVPQKPGVKLESANPVSEKDIKEMECDTKMSEDQTGTWDKIVQAIKAGEELKGKKMFAEAIKKLAECEVEMDETEMTELMSDFNNLDKTLQGLVKLVNK